MVIFTNSSLKPAYSICGGPVEGRRRKKWKIKRKDSSSVLVVKLPTVRILPFLMDFNLKFVHIWNGRG
jgi:hypothetical protein